MKNILIQAVNNREVLSFTYDGLSHIAEPHAVGISSAGNEVLRCYQTEGSHHKPGHDWELLTVSKIIGLRTTGAVFANARPGYKPGDKGMTRIYAEF